MRQAREFMARFQAAISAFQDEEGEVAERDLADYDECKTDWGEDALGLVEALATSEIIATRVPRSAAEALHERVFGRTFTLDADVKGDDEAQIDLLTASDGSLYLLLSGVEPGNPASAFMITTLDDAPDLEPETEDLAFMEAVDLVLAGVENPSWGELHDAQTRVNDMLEEHSGSYTAVVETLRGEQA